MVVVDLKSVRRVTIRLVAGLAIADFLAHINSILVIGTKKYIETSYCAGLAAISTFNRHLYAFTNIAISYHLYRVIVQLKKPSFKTELAVWIACIHWYENKVSCNPGAKNPTITKAVFGLITVFNLIAIVSGIYVTIASHRHLGLWIESFSNREFLDPKQQEDFKASKTKEMKRSFLYPISALITLSAEVVLCFWMVFDSPPLIMFTINGTMVGFKGILTLFTFMIDPTTQNALKYTFDKLRKNNLDKNEMNIHLWSV
ncbi:hypothetical protein CONCODRAFT_11701 [Conidiobolus coronatus NRRL 28638]|uniref:G-protein coupled receptors family 1 profile domain-containing protein n=1 Tax=Conidiobolus coronatus (strain ATCC 28846 / CBS 209.66 / NRRL 28638) TaxID=796925 RepID=A0A137NUQ6_CONC2|nr:hypothetical protein CONCODRAFT_11701 [Conidiobolus coronatus NRRL 28638]|eukprot:KXN66448.1 hypothetical protein CONCODRAFT_11701 [Conidiobolus coronatus NRRL 28638]